MQKMERVKTNDNDMKILVHIVKHLWKIKIVISILFTYIF